MMDPKRQFSTLIDMVEEGIRPSSIKDVLFKTKHTVNLSELVELPSDKFGNYADEFLLHPVIDITEPVWVARANGRVQSYNKGVRDSADVISQFRNLDVEILIASIVHFFLFKHIHGNKGEKFNRGRNRYVIEYDDFAYSIIEKHRRQIPLARTYTNLLPIVPIWDREIVELLASDDPYQLAGALDDHLFLYITALINGYFIYVPTDI